MVPCRTDYIHDVGYTPIGFTLRKNWVIDHEDGPKDSDRLVRCSDEDLPEHIITAYWRRFWV